MPLELKSPAFSYGGAIPQIFTCEGDNISPQLDWSGAPTDTKSFTLVCSDPDAPRGVYRHWAAYDIPANLTGLESGYGQNRAGVEFKEAVNDFGWTGYGGPGPPVGHGPHRYFFRLNALSVPNLLLPADAVCTDVIKAAEMLTIETSEWMGTYER